VLGIERPSRVNIMSKQVLIIGPSGAGKTYISAALREKGVNAIDGDLVDGLSGWFDSNSREVDCPPNADQEFLDSHEFLWNRDFLKNHLQGRNEIYLFGMSGNVFDMIDLFDKVYFLKASPELLAERLRCVSRENPMGKTDYQLQNALKWAKEIEEKASKLNIGMIDANQSPKDIFAQISK